MSRNKQKGTSFETALVPFLRVLWPHARRTGSESLGSGDFAETWPFVIESKSRKELRLGEWMKQIEVAAERIRQRDGVTLFPVVIHKRRMFGAHRAYVTQPVETWILSLLTLLDFSDAERERLRAKLMELSPSDAATLEVDPFKAAEAHPNSFPVGARKETTT